MVPTTHMVVNMRIYIKEIKLVEKEPFEFGALIGLQAMKLFIACVRLE